MSDTVIEIVRTKADETETVERAVYEHPLVVRLCHWLNAISLFVMVGSGLADFPGFSELWRQDSAEGFIHLAEIVCHRGMAGWRAAMAPDVHVDLHRDWSDVSRVSDFQWQLSAGLVYASGHSRSVADGEALFLFWAEASAARSL